MPTAAVARKTLGQFLAERVPGLVLQEYPGDDTYPNFCLTSNGTLQKPLSDSMAKKLVEEYFKDQRIELRLDEYLSGVFTDGKVKKLLVMTVSPRAGMIHASFAKM